MTAQDAAIDRLAQTDGLQYGRMHVSAPYSDGSVEVTVPSGEALLISVDGTTTPRPFNHSVDWSQ